MALGGNIVSPHGKILFEVLVYICMPTPYRCLKYNHMTSYDFFSYPYFLKNLSPFSIFTSLPSIISAPFSTPPI